MFKHIEIKPNARPVTYWISFSLVLLFAKPAFGSELTFNSLLQLIETTNPQILAAQHALNRVKEQAGIADALPDPSLNVDYFIDSVETRTGPQEYRVTLSQRLPWFGKRRIKTEIADHEVSVAESELAHLKNTLKLDLAKKWAQGIEIQNLIQITQEELVLLNQVERIANIRYRTATTSHPDFINVQLSKGLLTNKLSILDQQLKSIEFDIYRLANINTPQRLQWPLDFPTPDIKGFKFTNENQLSNNPRIQLEKHAKSLRDKQIELTELANSPDFNLKYGRIFTGESSNPEMPDSGKDPQFIGLGINIPIWNSTIKGNNAIAHQNKMIAEQRIISLENEIQAQLNHHQYLQASLKEQIQRYKSLLIPQAEFALSSILQSYQTGNASFVELIDSEKTLLTFRSQYISLQKQQWLSSQEIKFLLGE